MQLRGLSFVSVCLPTLLASFVGCGVDLPLESEQAAVSSALSAQESYRDLARHWAPRLYQDTADAYYVGDYPTRFNFDGDYNGKNNWQSLAAFSTVPAYVYYGVSETNTHWFIQYSVFHPRDWHEWNTLDEHENDLEGISLAVRKDGSTYGALVAMETLAHDQLYQYAYAPGIANGADTVDGTVTLWGGSHPRVFIEAKGHGIYNCDGRCDSAPGGDGVVFYEADVADSPGGGDGNWSRAYRYALIAMDADGSRDGNQGFWYRRDDVCDTCTFGAWGKLRGDDYGTDKAKTPWAWDDADDGQAFSGDMLCDPAALFDIHLNGTPFDSGFSHVYLVHPYRTHAIQILGVRSDANRDPFGGASDIYVKVTAPGAPAGSNDVIDARAWKKNSASVGTWYAFRYGAYDAEGQRSFGDAWTEHSFCRPGTPQVRIGVWDSDTDGDDDMGSAVVSDTVDAAAGWDLGDGRVQFRFRRY